MSLLRFIFFVYAFIAILAGSGAFVLTVTLLFRFPLLFVTAALTCLMFWILLMPSFDTTAEQ